MIKKNKIMIIVLVLVMGIGLIYYHNQKKVLTIGIFAGSSWDVPTFDYYEMIDKIIVRFEKEHPNVEVQYNSGILKDDYSLWLSNQLLIGAEPDLYMILNEEPFGPIIKPARKVVSAKFFSLKTCSTSRRLSRCLDSSSRLEGKSPPR